MFSSSSPLLSIAVFLYVRSDSFVSDRVSQYGFCLRGTHLDFNQGRSRRQKSGLMIIIGADDVCLWPSEINKN